jgi:hypothetical protein
MSLLCFLFIKIGEKEGGTGSAWKWGDDVHGGGGKQCIHL